MPSKKAVATKATTAVAAPSYLEQYAGEGAAASTDEMALPFLRIVEALSPQMKKTDPLYNKEADSGDIINTVTQELWGGEEGVAIIPVFKGYEYPMFKLREAGGGFLGMGNAEMFEHSFRDDRGRDVMKNDPSIQIVRSGTTYVLHLDPETGVATPAIIGCSSTRLRAWREWNTQINMLRVPGPNGAFQPPIFGVVWRMTTLTKSNDEGEWNIPVFKLHEPVEGLIGGIGGKFESLLLDSDLAEQARGMGESIRAGLINGNYEAEGSNAPVNHDPETGEIIDNDEDSPI